MASISFSYAPSTSLLLSLKLRPTATEKQKPSSLSFSSSLPQLNISSATNPSYTHPLHKRFIRRLAPPISLQFGTESFVQWSSLGTYLATVHRQGAAVWGGATTFNRFMRYAHPQVRLIDFSPGEKYLVTYSSHQPSNPRDIHKQQLIQTLQNSNLGGLVGK